MGCSAAKPAVTRDEIEAIVQRSQDTAQKDQAVREAKARESALKAEKDLLEKSLKADKEGLERTLKESKELHARTLQDLKEAREPKAAHEELLKAHEELLKAHEHLDDKHLHKVQEIEKFNKELKDQVDKLEASVGNWRIMPTSHVAGDVLKEVLKSPTRPPSRPAANKDLSHLEAMPIPYAPIPRPLPPQPHQPLEEPPSSPSARDIAASSARDIAASSTRDSAAATVQRGPSSPRLRKNFALSTDPGSDGVDNLWTRRWQLAQPPRHPPPDRQGPSRPGIEVGRPKMEQEKLAPATTFHRSKDDDLEVQSLHGREGDEEPNPPTAGKELRQTPADTVQRQQELPRETAGGPQPPQPVTVAPPTAAALENMLTVQNLLGAHAENVSAGGLDSTRPTTAATRPPTAPQAEAKDKQVLEPGTQGAGKGQVRKEDVIEVGVKLHKIMRESARAG